ncbi:uncharacterized protein LOC127953553 isoform X1 [Carassius gibelio]|uniref:uncharacterized protein LOC127953553 isoform X1 n=1 Tax=Carassius gibelio TaxID=101364 RepID=UPI0022791418|nr:uncharacterized protein LOC127953553 isoform X1 [Carassius gibelio]
MCFSFSLPMLKMEKKRMAETVDGKKEDADYKRVQSFPLIRHTDMPEEMRVETMELCVTACEKFASNNESAAKMIKESMDKKFGSSWHVVIGEGFGFEVVVGVCLLREAVPDRMCVAALHCMCHFSNAFPLSLCLSVSFILFPVQQCLSQWAALPPVSNSSFSFIVHSFVSYPFIVTPGILYPVLFSFLCNQHV